MKRTSIDLKEILREFSERPIAYQPIYAKITNGVTTGILLSQLVYWWYTMKEEVFYKTDKELSEELSMGLWELKSAKKKLISLSIITTKRKGQPAKTYYHVDMDYVITLITRWRKNHQLEVGKPTNKSEEKPPTIYTETTTETTTDINDHPSLFDEFWKLYPRKVGKFKAREAWDDLSPDLDLFQKIVSTLEKYKHLPEWLNGEEFIPHASTWLNQRRFEDEIVAKRSARYY